MIKYEENKLQSAIVNYLRYNDVFVFSVPNGQHISNLHTRLSLQRAGLLAGVSDLIVLTKNNIFFVEIKTIKGRQTRPQIEFEKIVKGLGYKYLILRSIEDSEKFLKSFKEDV